MNKIFNCCHGMWEPHQAHWICSTKMDGGRVDEEVIGDEGPLSAKGEDARAGGRSGVAKRGNHVPVGRIGGQEDEKETSKQRLQRLIRDFAHDAVGPGLDVEVQGLNAPIPATSTSNGMVEAKLRMDRKLSRLELWVSDAAVLRNPQESPGVAAQANANETCAVELPLRQVKQIAKRSGAEPGDVAEADGAAGGARTEAVSAEAASKAESPASSDRHAKGSADSSGARSGAVLDIMRRENADGPDLRIVFPTMMMRDKAYTCLRIFQMSVDQSAEGQSREGESDTTGCDSSPARTLS